MELVYRNFTQTVIHTLRQIYYAVYLLAAQPFLRKSEKTDAKAAQEHHLRRVMDMHGNRILRLAYSYLHNMQDAVCCPVVVRRIISRDTLQCPERRVWQYLGICLV